ncbi:hypothetical protein N656DRAFT_599660 [Canariomyces notabilis]|uniref:Uncharacterized protein n=1 Tax=Canariomyces notabilis TaxID=2074819 RepID=A0AAN6YU18_9PEZI|nr:hypothetical protein N656DRAFT_599660 [Canariomyces arenarius]
MERGSRRANVEGEERRRLSFLHPWASRTNRRRHNKMNQGPITPTRATQKEIVPALQLSSSTPRLRRTPQTQPHLPFPFRAH